MIITSSSNEQIKNIIQLKEKSKVRKQKKQFVVEGVKMFSEVPKEDLKYVYVTEEFEKKNKISLINTDYYMVSDSLFKKISDTINPQGVLAIVKQKEYSIDEILNNRNKEKSCIVVLDRLQDPGNLGTIIRTG